MEFLDFDDGEIPEEEDDPIMNELLESDSVEARAVRQLAVEDILAKVILSLYRLEELNQVGIGQEGIGARDILNILPAAVMDSAIGEVYGTAYTMSLTASVP